MWGEQLETGSLGEIVWSTAAARSRSYFEAQFIFYSRQGNIIMLSKDIKWVVTKKGENCGFIIISLNQGTLSWQQQVW